MCRSDGTVTPIDLSTGTPGAPIPVGVDPGAIAVTPDQAPTARLSVTRAPVGSPTTFDASASTVAFGTIASYAWDFGDGTTAVTTTPITTHTYTGGSYTASVTLTSSAGTSTARLFTGRTMTRNGGPQTRATVLGSLAQLGAPVVSQMIPSAGLVAGGTTVSIIGSGFTGVTAVTFGGVPAVSFTVNGDNSITAIAPAALAAATVDVSVANVLGISAVTPADEFNYLGSVPGVTVDCPTGGCIAVFPTASGMTVSASSSTGCAICNIQGGIELPGPQAPKCPGGAAPQLLPAGWVDPTQTGGVAGSRPRVLRHDQRRCPGGPRMVEARQRLLRRSPSAETPSSATPSPESSRPRGPSSCAANPRIETPTRSLGRCGEGGQVACATEAARGA